LRRRAVVLSRVAGTTSEQRSPGQHHRRRDDPTPTWGARRWRRSLSRSPCCWTASRRPWQGTGVEPLPQGQGVGRTGALTVARSGTRAGSAAAGTAPNLSHTTVVVSDVDAYHQRRSDEGTTILMAPTDQPRGLRSQPSTSKVTKGSTRQMASSLRPVEELEAISRRNYSMAAAQSLHRLRGRPWGFTSNTWTQT